MIEHRYKGWTIRERSDGYFDLIRPNGEPWYPVQTLEGAQKYIDLKSPNGATDSNAGNRLC